MTRPNPHPAIAVSWGDPAGIGPETVLKAFGLLPKGVRRRIVLHADPAYMTALDARLGTGVPMAPERDAGFDDDLLRIAPLSRPVKFDFDRDFGKEKKAFGAAAIESVERAMDAVLCGQADALVTAPINKASVNKAGFHVPGHTEFLAQRAGVEEVVMMLTGRELSVVVVTTHHRLADVPALLTKEKIVATLTIVDASFKRFGIARPRLAVTGLNPHASDHGVFGDEEARIIAPAIKAARKKGIDATGPFPADTMFSPAARKTYDCAVAMYHDQGLIPIKTLSFGETVNVTLGLPFLRVSVDHGTAFDIAGTGRADGAPMRHAIMTARAMLAGRMR
ncbi:MAG: 4-hydroxythreonine-4-phosphate dehydrogenase PdxA [Nitrospinae bacterium]|nr:4-hydroxythreonine-4-phosphate dehydrogenase PdxA [Nitrospinota bacterium]